MLYLGRPREGGVPNQKNELEAISFGVYLSTAVPNTCKAEILLLVDVSHMLIYTGHFLPFCKGN